MKKLCFLFLCFFTADSFGSGIASNTASAPCTNNTLETYSGNSNLSADWQPNEIQLRWYNNNTQITPTNTDANTCTYDGSLAIPQNAPTRTGYTFAGWEVVPEYDFSTLPTDRYIEGYAKITNRRCYIPWEDIVCDDRFSDLNDREWKFVFEWGTIYGMALCSSSDISVSQPDESSGGQYCWCKVTTYKPSNSNISYKPSKKLPWIYSQNYSSGSCTRCAFSCAANLRGSIRRLFGQ